MPVLGIDIGGSGIKGAPVNPETGELLAPRKRVPTPDPSQPAPVVEEVTRIVTEFQWNGPIACTFPAVIQNGTVLTAANVHDDWIGVDAADLLSKRIGSPVAVLNDADAAGLAEVRFGAGRGVAGVILVLTFGTGIGSALIVNGTLVPNTELGHLILGNREAEEFASARVRDTEDLSWKAWGKRVNKYLKHLELLLCPDLIIIGGGASNKYEKFVDSLNMRVEVRPAELRNNAGLIGAALASPVSALR